LAAFRAILLRIDPARPYQAGDHRHRPDTNLGGMVAIDASLAPIDRHRAAPWEIRRRTMTARRGDAAPRRCGQYICPDSPVKRPPESRSYSKARTGDGNTEITEKSQRPQRSTCCVFLRGLCASSVSSVFTYSGYPDRFVKDRPNSRAAYSRVGAGMRRRKPSRMRSSMFCRFAWGEPKGTLNSLQIDAASCTAAATSGVYWAR